MVDVSSGLFYLLYFTLLFFVSRFYGSNIVIKSFELVIIPIVNTTSFLSNFTLVFYKSKNGVTFFVINNLSYFRLKIHVIFA